ncbi:TPA: YhcH/YjgK/YiaL family protein [Streptococcus suis]
MIIDRIERLINYESLLPNLNNAFQAIEKIENREEGIRYPFDGGFLFFQSGHTKNLVDAQFEAHRKYIDVQLVLEGAEYVSLQDKSQVEVLLPYDRNRDVEKYVGEAQHTLFVNKGMGYVCFPWDIHQAVFHFEQPTYFEKVVIKLEIQEN